MKTYKILFSIFVLLAASIAYGTYTTANYMVEGGANWVVGGGGRTGTLTIGADGNIVGNDGQTITFPSNNRIKFEDSESLLLDFATNNVITLVSDSSATVLDFNSIVPKTGSLKCGSVTYSLTGLVAADGNANDMIYTNGSGKWGWKAASATFLGGDISGDCTIANGIYLKGSNESGHTWGLKLYNNTTSAYVNGILFTNGTTPAISVGAATTSFALTSTGLNVNTAGVITGAGGITNTGALTTSGGAVSINANSGFATNINTGSSTSTTTIGGGLSSCVIDTSVWDITGAGAMSGFSSLSLSGDITMANGKVIKGDALTGHTIALQAYDTDTGYENSILLTNGTVPAVVIGSGTDTVAVDSADWDIDTTGNMSGIGNITSNGLFTCTGGETMSGTVSINDSQSTATTSIGGGTTTGTITIGGTAAQTVAVGSGGTSSSAKVVTVGSTSGASATTIQSGTADVTITSTDDISITATDDVALNGGSGGSLVNIGTNTHGNYINIGTNDDNADTIAVGSAKDGVTVVGATVGVNGAVSINASNGTATTNIGTGNTTGAIGIGNSAAGAITIASNATSTWTNNTGDLTLTGNKSINLTPSEADADAVHIHPSDAASGISLVCGTGNVTFTTTAPGGITVSTGSAKTMRHQVFPISHVSATAVSVLGGTGLTCVGLSAGAAEIGATTGYTAVDDDEDFLVFYIPLPRMWIDTGTQADLQLQFYISEQATGEQCDIDVRIFEFNNTTPILTDTIAIADGAAAGWKSLVTNATGIGNDDDIDGDDSGFVVEITANTDNDDFYIYGARWVYRVGLQATQ